MAELSFMLHVQRKHLTASPGFPQERIVLQGVTVQADVTCPFPKIFSFCLLTLKPHNEIISFAAKSSKTKHIHSRKILVSRMSHSFCFQRISCKAWQQRAVPLYHLSVLSEQKRILSNSSGRPLGSQCFAAGPAGLAGQPSLISSVRYAWRDTCRHKNMGGFE